jgi:hypothetical protein
MDPRWIVVGDGDNQFLRGPRFPHEVTLKVGQHHRARVHLGKKIFECSRVCVFKQARLVLSYLVVP